MIPNDIQQDENDNDSQLGINLRRKESNSIPEPRKNLTLQIKKKSNLSELESLLHQSGRDRIDFSTLQLTDNSNNPT